MISNDMVNDPNNKYYGTVNHLYNKMLAFSDNLEMDMKNIIDRYQSIAKHNPKVADYYLKQARTNLINSSMENIKDIMHTYQPIADKEWFEDAEAQLNSNDKTTKYYPTRDSQF